MSARVVVAGGGLAGSLVAVLLGGVGARVSLVDPYPAADEPPDRAWRSQRLGCPQMHHTHNFLAAYWKVVRDHAPDVVDDLVLAGAARSGSPERLHARRTTVRSALAAALRRRDVDVVASSVRQVDDARDSAVASLADGRRLVADLVVDASGRRSRLADLVTVADEPAGIVYLSRHYRPRAGVSGPAGPVAGFGRGYVASHAAHDNGTYSCVLGVDTARDRARVRASVCVLRDGPAFDLALSRIPGFAPLVDRDSAEALHEVQVMGNLRNTLRVPRSLRTREVALGDALGTTDPSRGRGSALAAEQASCLAGVVAAGAAPAEAAAHYYDTVLDPLRSWFADAQASSRWRAACWATGTEPAPLASDPLDRSAWEWLQTPPADDAERGLRVDYSQMCATPEQVVAAGRARGDEGRAPATPTVLAPFDTLLRPRGACLP